MIARHVERVIRGTTFPAGKVTSPGIVQWDVKGDTTSVRSNRSWLRSMRSAAGRAWPRRHADHRRRGRAPAVAQGDLQRGDEPSAL
jgi:hypothetical protein